LTDTPQPTSTTWPVFASLSGYAARNIPQDLIAGLTLAAIAFAAFGGGIAAKASFIA
jgi:MFS superfamily sulfate permease-like transporter